MLAVSDASADRVEPCRISETESSAVTLVVPPDGVPEKLETSTNDAMVPFGATRNPEADSSPVNRKDTQDELDSGTAQLGSGAAAIVFSTELNCGESIAVPVRVSGMVPTFIFVAADREKRRSSAAQMRYLFNILSPQTLVRELAGD